ncbi:MAG: MgtC/SapB family protein [Armatimonadetes bacterium]|nr:MgtC/SapB family protein [Armatimonadota bacterium]
MAGKLLLTLLLCGAIGLERSTHERASGFRTHILVGLGACLITLAGAYGFAGMWPDRNPLVLATYVVSGIGFLGAGAILRHGTTVRGLTTAASLWSVAGVGIAVGAGLGGLATVTALLILFTLVPLQKWESRLPLGPATHSLAIHLSNEEGLGKALVALGKQRLPVKRTTIVPGAGASAVLRVELNAALQPQEVSQLVERLTALKQVERVETGLLNVDEEQPASRLMQYGTRRIHLRLPRRRNVSDHPQPGNEEAAEHHDSEGAAPPDA